MKLIRNSIGKPVTLIDTEGTEIREYNISDGVTSIGNYAFTNCTGLTSVTIPNSVTTIEESAFMDCSGLASVTISDGVTSIGNSAFYGCSGLTSMTIPNSVTTIGNSAFNGCSGLTSVTIGESVTSIGDYAFRNCSGLTSVTILCPTVGSWFSGKSSIKEVIFGDSVTTISNYAFENCSGLSSIILYPNLVSIGYSTFYGCNSINNIKVVVTNASTFCNNGVMKLIRNSIGKPVTLIDNEGIEIKDYNIPDGVTSIGNYAFTNCTGLLSVTIPNSVATIGYDAFDGCSSLTSIAIPNSVTSIGNSAFSGCSGLTSVSLNCKNVGSWFSGNSSIKEVILGNNVESIGSSAFSGCSGLVSVTIPNSVTSIGYDAFRNCSKLLSLIIGTGVITIGQNAFANTNLKKTKWLTNTPPSGYQYASGAVNYVANEQYSNLYNKIIYPFISSLFEADGIYYVPVSPSERICDAIDCRYNETMTNTNISSTVSYQGIDMTVQKIQPYLCYGNTYIENLKCENNGDIAYDAFAGCINIKSVVCNNNGIIDDNAFESCSNMTSLSLGENITSIGKNSFRDCSSLKIVNIPNSVTILDDYSFSGCSSLEEIVIGNHVKTISQYAFEDCKSLQSINIPNSVNTISNYVFKGCIGLRNLIIADRDSELSLGRNGSSPLFANCPLDSVYIGGNITYDTSSNAGYSPFYRNTTLRTVVITDKETEISPNEFYGCTNLQNFSIGDGVTTIGDWAFSGCSSLNYFAFGYNMETIGKEAFSDCSAMTNLYSNATTPPICGSQALDDINKWNCKLHVPSETLSTYQQADQWKEFFFINDDLTLPFYKLTYMVDGIEYKTCKMEPGATITPEAEPTKDTYKFSGWSEIPETMPTHDVVVTGTFERYFDVGNLTKAIDFIMNSNASAEETALYDLNDNEKMDIGDVILIVKSILNNSNNVSSFIEKRVAEVTELGQYTAAQFEVKTAGNVDLRLAKSMEQTHQLKYQQKDANTYAVVVYSLTNQLMQPENGKIIETDNISDILSIENVTVATPTGETAYYQTLSTTTGIEQIGDENGTVVVYDLKGNRLNSGKALDKGIYIVNGKKTVVR